MANKPTYSWEEFLDAYNKSGVNFSDADMKMAQLDPNYGMSTINNKLRWANAGTDEERALIHQEQEDLRSSRGGYTGGIDGSMYIMQPLSPIDYSAPDKPVYGGSSYGGDLQNLWNQQMNYGSFSFNEAQPTYTNRYDDRIQAKLQKVENPDPFSYDPATDQLYQNYRKQYTREGQRATADALGAAAAASGGLPSSYAQTAAGQAANYYAAQMTDKIPELYNLAYQKYLGDFQMQQAGLAALQTAEQSDYDKYRGELNQHNVNRDFARGIWNDEYNHLANNVQTAQSLDNQEYQRYLDALNQYNIDRNFGYQQTLDEIQSQTNERNEALQAAVLAAQYGDYTQLNRLGINTDNNPTDYERRYNEAVLAAQYGDYSGLLALGIDPNMLNVNNAALASGGEYYGDGGYYLSGGYSNGGAYGGGGGTYTGSTATGVDNEGLTYDQVVALQRLIGTTADGQIGPNTRSAILAAGYTSAQAAYNALVGGGALPAPGNYDSGTQSGTSSGGGDRSYNSNQGDPEILAIQKQLNAAGYNVAEDGILGPETIAAVEKYNRDLESADTPKTPTPSSNTPTYDTGNIQIANVYDDNYVNVPGYGRVKWTELERLIDADIIREAGRGGKMYYYVNPAHDRDYY